VLFFDVLQGIELSAQTKLHPDFVQELMEELGDLPSGEIVALDCVR
jgi:hypothetical protein